ncbi:ROK family protein [Roseomonas elaeocarpi]|uniref:ROK family protein n=1 Tax=Roseomonas elaeocarpi TaxID=907779 RepID=A0ABV6JPR9_9PROT
MTASTQGEAPQFLGIDLGGTQLRVALVDAAGQVLAAERRETDLSGPDAVIAQMVALIGILRGPAVRALGVGVPGTIDRAAGTVLGVPALPGWGGVALAERLRTATGLPVVLENDAKAACIGEWRAGAGMGSDNLAYVTVSTGIGAGIIAEGRLLRGAAGLAGELGHTRLTEQPIPCACGRTGCWQALVSGPVLAARARAVAVPGSRLAALAEGVPLSSRHVGVAAAEGDATALALLAEMAEWLGVGFANLQHSYDSERIVVGGGVSALLEPMRAGIEATLRARLLPGFRPATILRAALGDDAGLVGTAMAARDATERGAL